MVLHREMKNVALFLGILLALLLAVFSSASAALAGADDSNIRRLQSKGSKAAKGSKAPKGSKASKGSKACNVQANDDTYTTSDPSEVELNVLDNDSFPDGNKLTVTHTLPKDTTETVKGMLTFDSGKFLYTPDAAFGVGELTFTYTIEDGECGSDTATVTISDEDTCFPAGSIVQVVREGELVPEPIENLALGDEVKCISERTREVSTCTVFYHFHPSKDIETTNIFYKKISYKVSESTTDIKSIKASGNHMMYRLPQDGTYSLGDNFETIPDFTDSLVQFPAAENIQVGNLLAVEDPEDTESMVVAEVTSIDIVTSRGAYAPFVSDGMMFFVDGALVSSMALSQRLPVADEIYHYLFATNSRYFYSQIVTNEFDMTAVWGLTLADPAYIAWEKDNYDPFFYRLSYEYIVPAIIEAKTAGFTLSASNAILYNKVVRELTGWPLNEEAISKLLAQAYRGELEL